MFFHKFVDLCNSIGKSPSAVAEEMGYQRSVVTRWSKGTTPRQATLHRIAAYFNVPVDFLAPNNSSTANLQTAIFNVTQSPVSSVEQKLLPYVAYHLLNEQTKKPATVSGDELDETTREIMDILSDLTPEELALAKARLLKIKESR